jgi:hypothetical protein
MITVLGVMIKFPLCTVIFTGSGIMCIPLLWAKRNLAGRKIKIKNIFFMLVIN